MDKKKASILTVAAAITALSLTAKIVDSYYVSTPIAIPSPVIAADSVNPKGESFSMLQLIDDSSVPEIKKLNPEVIVTDTTGIVALTIPKEGAMMQIAHADIRADHFAKGKFVITSTEPFKVYVNEEETDSSKEVCDSLQNAEAVTVMLTLEPQEVTSIDISFYTIAGKSSENPSFKTEFIPDKDYEDVAVTVSPELKKRVTLATTGLGRRCTSVEVSADGQYVLAKFSEPQKGKSGKRYAELYDPQTANMITTDLPSDLRWTPRGHTMYYTKKGDKGYDIYTLELPSMKRTRVADGLPDNNFVWSPDMSYLIYNKDYDAAQETRPVRRLKNPDDRIPGNDARSYLMKYDLHNGLSSPLTYGGSSNMLLDISQDGKKIIYTTTEMLYTEFPFYFNDLVMLDMNTMKTDTIVRHEAYLSSATFSPDAKQLFVVGGPGFYGGVGLAIPEGKVANDYDKQAFLLDIASGKVTPLTKDFDPSVGDYVFWNKLDGQIYFNAEAGFGNNIYTLNPKTLAIKQLPAEVSSVYTISIGNDENKWLAYRGGDFDRIEGAYLMSLKNGVTHRLTHDGLDNLADTEFGKMEPWVFEASDGTPIDGVCVLPPDFDPDKKYPLIVYYYGGTSPSTARLSTPYAPHLFASRGYVVYVLNPSGTTGYGQEFSARHVNAWGNRTSDDIIEGVKLFCKDHPFVNDKKIGCIGASYGGFMTQYLLTRTDIFAAAVSHAGISNVTSYWGEGYWGFSYNTVAAAESYPWNNPKLFAQGSLFNADKIHTPLLLLHGTADTNVPIGESIQIFNALKILGRDVEFITVDGEDHFINDYEKRELWHATIMAWFAKWLQDDPLWWNSMYPSPTSK